ncbi:MAG: hypothetical protein Q8P88_02720 [Candidatus Jorgensenbacteria bacterium]|nr:hypothetical protein [Candidatus Jorgensenbacteria bacterium]
MTEFTFILVTFWAPLVVPWLLVLVVAGAYFFRRAFLPFVVRITGVLYVLVVAAQTFAQYLVWSGDSLSSKLLPPHQSILYFLKYAGVHFWLAPLIALIVALAFYTILRALKDKNARFFEEGEVELGALAAFLVGWPRVIVFLPIVFLAVVSISGIKMALRKNAYTTLGIPFLIGLTVALACGYTILQTLRLESLAIIPGVR